MKTISLNEEAEQVIHSWRQDVNNLRMFKGEEVYSKSLSSLSDMLASVISLGGEIFGRTSETDSSLIADNGMIVYGVICRQSDDGSLDFTVHS